MIPAEDDIFEDEIDAYPNRVSFLAPPPESIPPPPPGPRRLDEVLRAIPRRARLQGRERRVDQPYLRRVSLPKVSVFVTALRSMRWLFAFILLGLELLLDRVRGRRNIHNTAEHSRRMFERIGGTAVKLGQQMAVRVDLLPFEVCQELARLLDAVPPFDVSYAIERIEAVSGKKVSELFAELNPKPIGSASIACVFEGRLHTGERVAIKVRRPSVGEQFIADMKVVVLTTRIGELFTIVRPDFFKYLRSELTDMLLEELDFRKEATFQTLFARWAKKDRIDWLKVPKVYTELSSADILTTSFEEGIPCSEILAAVETKDAAMLAMLAEREIDPAKLGERIMLISFWGRQERPLYHADPHPGNILVRPGNEIVLLDFGACGVSSRQNVEIAIESGRRLNRDDFTGCAAVMMGMIMPLPYIDFADLNHRLERAMYSFYVGAWTKDAEWYDRTTAKLWLGMLEVSREFQLPINLEVLRYFRATLLYDTLACRLSPRINVPDVFDAWETSAAERTRRRNRDRLERITPRRAEMRAAAIAADTYEMSAKSAFWVGNATRLIPFDNQSLMSSGAFFMDGLLRFVTTAVWFGGLVVGAVALYSWLTIGDATLPVIAVWTLNNRIYTGAVFLLFVLLVRRVLFRLNDKDKD